MNVTNVSSISKQWTLLCFAMFAVVFFQSCSEAASPSDSNNHVSSSQNLSQSLSSSLLQLSSTQSSTNNISSVQPLSSVGSLSSSNTSSSSQPLFGEMMDSRDNKVYKTIQLGNQIWMAENLNYGTFVKNQNDWDFLLVGAQKFCYDDLEINCDRDGGLYQWHTALGLDTAYVSKFYNMPSGHIQGICPVGWHIPKKNDWDGLINYLKSDLQTELY